MIAGFLGGAAHGSLATATSIMLEIEPTTGGNDDISITYGPFVKHTATGGFIVAWVNLSSDILLFYVDRAGAVKWGKRYAGTGTYASLGMNIADLGNGNFAIGFFALSSNRCGVLVFSMATGSLIWGKYATDPDYLCAGSDGQGNVYISGSGYIAKLDYAGTTQWRYQWEYSGSPEQYDFAVLPSASAAHAGYSTISSFWRTVVFAVDSSGSFLWDKYYSVGDQNHDLQKVVADNAGTIIVSQRYNALETHIFKASMSDGSISWARKITYAANVPSCHALCVDSSNNIYLLIQNETASPDSVYLMKYNSSGTLQSQVKITTTGNSFVGKDANQGLSWASGFLCIAISGTTDHCIILRIADDLSESGAKAGEDDTITFAATSDMVDAASTITANDITATYASDSFALSAESPTVTAYTDYTTTVTAI